MDETLRRIKRAVMAGQFKLTVTARAEMDLCALTDEDVIESLVMAQEITKTLRSTSRFRTERREYLHVIISPNFAGIPIYAKGKLEQEHGEDIYDIFISAKHAE